jgi:hypothetical protein
MEIRNLLVIFVGAAALRGEPTSPIKTYLLDERTVYAIAIGTDEPTTCLFPGALTALESANLSLKAEDRPPVLMSYQPGAPFFSIRALRTDAHAAVNVVYHGKVFVLNFAAAPTADRAIAFQDEPSARPARLTRRATPEILRALLERAKHFPLLQAQYPALAREIDHATPNTVSFFKDFTVTVEDVFRFDAEDVLIFRLRLTNSGKSPVRYDAKNLSVRVGRAIYPAALSDASGVIPPQESTEEYFAIAGSPDEGRANLSVKNSFSILVPRPA